MVRIRKKSEGTTGAHGSVHLEETAEEIDVRKSDYYFRAFMSLNFNLFP